MIINGKHDPFDLEQSKSSVYKELCRIPVKQGTTVTKYSHVLKTASEINILNFLHDGEGELRLEVQDPPFKRYDGVFTWWISWDSTGCDGEFIVYGN